MANSYVRTLVKGWLGAGSLPFHDTNNIEQNPRDPYWCTVDWGFGTVSRETFCEGTLERGSFTVVFFGPAGVGDMDLLTRAEPAITDLMASTDPIGAVTLLVADAPLDFLQGPWFGLEYNVEYEFRA